MVPDLLDDCSGASIEVAFWTHPNPRGSGKAMTRLSPIKNNKARVKKKQKHTWNLF
jgi:hypothetical protein